MEKLVKLLIEKDGYDDVEYKIQSDGGYMFWCDGMAYREERICSKKFGFIERLVKNDKIPYSKIHKIGYIGGHDGYIGYDICCEEPRPNDYECLIMELSIQDNPIDYLCSILKE